MKVKSSIIEECIEVENYKGETVLSIPYRVNLATAYDAIAKKRNEYKATLQTGDLEKVGEATMALIESVFGADVTEQLLDYYKDDYTALITDIRQHFTEIIYPAIERQRETMLAAKKRAKR